jgi:hypothetical protein
VGDSELLAYANHGLDWIARRHPARRTASIEIVDRLGTVPDDVLIVTRVYASTGTLTTELSETVSFQPTMDEYSVIERETIKIGNPRYTSVTIAYDGLYPEIAEYVEDEDEEVEAEPESSLPIPRWLEEALFYYVGSRAMTQRASDMSTINQWDSKNDSGNPEHNPMLQVARHFEELAERALNRPGGH